MRSCNLLPVSIGPEWASYLYRYSKKKKLSPVCSFFGDFLKKCAERTGGICSTFSVKVHFIEKKSRRKAAQDVSDLLVCLAGQRGEKLLRGCPEENSQHGQGVSDVLLLSAVGDQEIIDAVIDDGGAK